MIYMQTYVHAPCRYPVADNHNNTPLFERCCGLSLRVSHTNWKASSGEVGANSKRVVTFPSLTMERLACIQYSFLYYSHTVYMTLWRLRLILIGEFFFQNFQSLEIIGDMCRYTEAFCHYSWNSPEEAKISSSLTFQYLEKTPQENTED